MRRLNAWLMILHATGVAHVLMAAKFLDEVVYGALVLGKDWRVVHELLVVYLRAVDDDSATLNLGNVYASGGQDTKLREAEANMLVHFRGQRGGTAPGNATKRWDCAFDANARRPCISYNLKQDHPASAIDPATGKCKFKHVCDAFITGADGKRTQCGSADHCRKDCNNPARSKGDERA